MDSTIKPPLKKLYKLLHHSFGCWFPNLNDEVTFLQYQIHLKETGTRCVLEAMHVLDIIDSKTEALLAYISVSVAAMVFLLTSFHSNTALKILFVSRETGTLILLIITLALLTAIVFCLSCLNIVGAHTVKALKATTKEGREKEYENLVLRVTLGRRTRYLIAHRISMVTAISLIFVFILLILGSSGLF